MSEEARRRHGEVRAMAKLTTGDGPYATHAEVLNKFFGTNYRCYQRAEWKLDEEYSVWFPVVTRTTNPTLARPASNGWKNLLLNDDTEIHQYWPDPIFATGQILSERKRIVFYRDSSGGRYVFAGVFAKDASQSDMKHTVYRRIATTYPL